MIKRLITSTIATSLLLSASTLPALAQTNMTPGTNRTARTEAARTLDIACIQAAVDKREAAIIAAVDTYHSTVKTALETRRAALKAAWAIPDRTQRRAAIKAAWDAFRGTWRTASNALHKTRRDAWKQYRTDRRACGPTATSDDLTAESADTNL